MPTPRTICYLANALSIHTQRWATHFSNLGHEVHVISFDDAVIPGARVHHLSRALRFKPLYMMLALARVRRILREIRPDILHAHYATSYGVIGALCGFRPLVITAWGTDVLIMPVRYRTVRWLLMWAFRRAALVTTMAEHMTTTLQDLGLRASHTVTLPFGTDTGVFHPGLRVADQDIDVICTRPCSPIYNVKLLIDSLPFVVEQYPSLRCALIGGGTLHRELMRLADDYGLQSNIIWVGAIALPDVATWLGRSKIFVSPSLSDGNNISLNEAMACGCFPVCTDIPANREWLQDGKNGFLVPVDKPKILADRIITALQAPELRRESAAMGWQIVLDRADWQKNMGRMETYYQSLVAAK